LNREGDAIEGVNGIFLHRRAQAAGEFTGKIEFIFEPLGNTLNL
jgi:hypothetical protein